jgi:hypothetical protein
MPRQRHLALGWVNRFSEMTLLFILNIKRNHSLATRFFQRAALEAMVYHVYVLGRFCLATQ